MAKANNTVLVLNVSYILSNANFIRNNEAGLRRKNH